MALDYQAAATAAAEAAGRIAAEQLYDFPALRDLAAAWRYLQAGRSGEGSLQLSFSRQTRRDPHVSVTVTLSGAPQESGR